MRIFPVLTALFVIGLIYLVILERQALLSFAGVTATEAADPQEAPQPVADDVPADVRVVALRSTQQEVENTVVLRGRTEAARQVEIRAETSGLIISEPLRRGAVVEAGDPLCELSPGMRNAALSEARARLSEAEINFRAAEGLSEGGFASEIRVANARAALQSAQAGVDSAVEELARLVMHAPFDGILETDTAELGSLLQPGALCATLIRLDPIKLIGFATERQIDLLSTGQPAGARLASGRDVAGTVTFLARSADPQTRTFRVEVTVPNPDSAIRDGQSADILIRAAPAKGHLVPGSAVTLNDSGALGVRAVDEDGKVSFYPVEVLRDTDTGLWLGGLPSELDVIVLGQEFVRDGARAQVTYRDASDMPEVTP